MPPQASGKRFGDAWRVFRTAYWRPVQGRAIPVAQIRGGIVRSLQKFEQGGAGRCRTPDIVIHQHELPQAGVIKRHRRKYAVRRIAWRLWGGIRIECRTRDFAAAGPESGATALMRICFARDRVCPFAFGRATPGETGRGKIEAAPEEMYRTGLADEPAAESLQNCVGLQQNPMEPVHILCVVRRMSLVVGKGDGICDLDWRRPYGHVNAGGAQGGHDFPVEIRYGAGIQAHEGGWLAALPNLQIPVGEIEFQFEHIVTVGDCGSGQPARTDV